MKQWNQNEFGLRTLSSGQVVGAFPALERLSGIAHAVTTRSCGDFGPAHRGSDVAAFGFITATLGVPDAAWAEHVHGTQVLVADHPGRAGAADGIVTRRPGLAIMAFSADCTDILIADPAVRAVGAIHAGWKGAAGRGASSLVRAMAYHFGSRPADLVACVGPSIGPCCFGANEEMIAEVRANYGQKADEFLSPRRKHVAFDLWRANVLDLQSAGVPPDNIHVAGLCTYCRNDIFFSHQKELQTGTFCSAIALTEAD
jgi:hypothetical protein